MEVIKTVLMVFVGLFAVVVAALWIAGGGDGRWRHEDHVTINQAPDLVWDWLIEPEKIRRWVGGLVELTPLTPGRPALGSRSREVIEEHGERIEMQVEITRFEPFEVLCLRLTGERFRSTVTYRLIPVGGRKTRVTYECESEFDGFLMRVFEPIIGMSAQERVNEDLEALRVGLGG
jgi:uncharacterized protein YndB with AHSA1/START domain